MKFALSILLITCLAPRIQAVVGDDFGRISGKVTSKTSESGISGATIILFEDGAVKFSTRTDQNGNFSFVNIPAGTYMITAKKSSFSDFAKSIRVNARFTLKLRVGLESLDQTSGRPVLATVNTPKAAPLSTASNQAKQDNTSNVPVSAPLASTSTGGAVPPSESTTDEPEMILDETVEAAYVENPDSQPEPVGGLPGIIKNIEYPQLAIQRKLEGTVLIKVIVNQYGDPVQCMVIRSVDPTLDEAAMNTIYKSKFIPGIHNGRAVVSTVAIPVKYKL